ncbi:TA system antitoxin ParD family protein [Photobacterium leiognathi]|uniref:TA system antitoxin ParD family protein n=1 Tax=Photobacterium leiognathi TaxID=553611 RepID=UPI002981D67F|nr:hypothetical protein [Photobacterium leiognathi]
MAASVRLSDELVADATAYAEAESRSVPKQIEHWAKVGRMMIDNPDLSYAFVLESLQAKAEMDAGLTVKYVRRTKRN